MYVDLKLLKYKGKLLAEGSDRWVFLNISESAHVESQNQFKKMWKISCLLISELVLLLKKCMSLKGHFYLAEGSANYSGKKETQKLFGIGLSI